MPLCFAEVYGSFCAITAELSSYSRGCTTPQERLALYKKNLPTATIGKYVRITTSDSAAHHTKSLCGVKKKKNLIKKNLLSKTGQDEC